MVSQIDPVDEFRARLLGMVPGETFIYHRGRLSIDRTKMPSLHNVAILANGLQILRAAQLSQQRIAGTETYEYRVRTNRSIRNVDFDHGRKTYLAELKEE